MFLYMNIFYLDGKLKIQLNKKKKQEKLISMHKKGFFFYVFFLRFSFDKYGIKLDISFKKKKI